MDMLDAGDDFKKELLRKSAKHKEEIEGDFKLITESTEKIITNALIIGGSLALTYYVVRQFSGGSKKKRKSKTQKIKLVQSNPDSPVPEVVQQTEPSEPGLITQVGAALASQASVFLLNLAKEKLMEYLQTVAEKKKQTP